MIKEFLIKLVVLLIVLSYETSFSYRLYGRNTRIQKMTIIASKIRCHYHHHLAAKVSKGNKFVEFRIYGEGRVVGWNLK